MEKNPKLPMSKMVSVISAKWREFIELKEQNEANVNNAAAAEVTQDESEPADLNDDVNDEQEENGRGRGRRTRKRPADFEQADVDLEDNDESYSSNTRRSSRGGKKLAPIKFKFGASPATPTPNGGSNGTSESNGKAAATTSKNSDSTAATAAAKKAGKRRKKRNEGEENSNNYNDSDAEFEAMLEEQCRIDEAEFEKRKKKAAAKKQTPQEPKQLATSAKSIKLNKNKKKAEDGYEVVVIEIFLFSPYPPISLSS